MNGWMDGWKDAYINAQTKEIRERGEVTERDGNRNKAVQARRIGDKCIQKQGQRKCHSSRFTQTDRQVISDKSL